MDNLTEKRHPIAELLLFIVIALSSMIVFSLIGMAINFSIWHIIQFDYGNPEHILPMKLMQLFNALGLFIIPPVIYYQFIKKEPLPHQFHTNNKLILSIISIIMIYAAMPFIEWVTEINQAIPLPQSLADFFKQLELQTEAATKAMLTMNNFGEFLFTLLIVGIIPAIGEELFFRGVLQRILIRWVRNPYIGITFTALLFSILHLEFSGLIARFLLGLVLGLTYYWSKNLAYPMLIHFLNNGSVVIYIYFTHTNINQLENYEFINKTPVITAISFIFLTITLKLFYNYTSKNNDKVIN